jgi:DNA-binding protein HU-beta
VIKLDIVNRVAERTGVPKMKAEQAVDALFHSMKEALARGERIELRGFGVFVVKPRKRGVGRNPRTGEEVAIPSGKTIRFKPGKELQAHGFEGEDGEHDHDEHEEHDHDGEPAGTPTAAAAAEPADASNRPPDTSF